jgi:hypothetical protein
MGSLSAKNESEKFSRLGTFKNDPSNLIWIFDPGESNFDIKRSRKGTVSCICGGTFLMKFEKCKFFCYKTFKSKMALFSKKK